MVFYPLQIFRRIQMRKEKQIVQIEWNGQRETSRVLSEYFSLLIQEPMSDIIMIIFDVHRVVYAFVTEATVAMAYARRMP